MDRREITIRFDQSAWIERQNIDLSRFVRDAIDEERARGLAADYRENAGRARKTNEQWSNVSREANDHLGSRPTDG